MHPLYPHLITFIHINAFSQAWLNQHTYWLDSNEKILCQTTTLTPTKKTYLLGRWAIRYLLDKYAHLPPDNIIIQKTPRGKPYLQNQRIHFNITHSGCWLIIALTTTQPIGVDYEQLHNKQSPLNIAKRFFTSTEVTALDQYPHEQKKIIFNQMWSAKEAILKATGAGIAHMLDQVSISPQTQQFYFNDENYQTYQLNGFFWDGGWLHVFSRQPLNDFSCIELTPTLEIEKIHPNLIQSYTRSATL